MLGSRTPKSIPQDIENWEHQKVRLYLMQESAGFRMLITKLRSLYGVKNRKSFNQLLDYCHSGLNQKLDLILSNIADRLDVDRYFLESTLLNKISPNGLNGWLLPIFPSSREEPITDEGLYIKVSPETQRIVVDKAFDEIKSIYKKWNEDKNIKGSRQIISKGNIKRPHLKSYIWIYKIIEERIYANKNNTDFVKHYNENQDKREEIDKHIFLKEMLQETCVDIRKAPNGKNIRRLKDIYLTKILKYYNLPSFREYIELQVTSS